MRLTPYCALRSESGTRRPSRGGIPEGCDGTRVPIRQPRGLAAPGGCGSLLESLAALGDLTVPGVAFRHPRSAICVPGHPLASRSAPLLELRDRTLSH